MLTKGPHIQDIIQRRENFEALLSFVIDPRLYAVSEIVIFPYKMIHIFNFHDSGEGDIRQQWMNMKERILGQGHHQWIPPHT